MIIVALKGGFGNQLFQYAAGLHLSNHFKVPVKVDTTLLDKPDPLIGTIRNFDLQHLQAPPTIATISEIQSVKGSTVIQFIEKFIPPYKRNVFKEVEFRYDTNFLKCKAAVYLKGYRQSELYFKPIEKNIRDAFILKDELIRNVKKLAIKLAQLNSVAVHVRRSDYNKKGVKEYHGVLDETYYNQAIELAQSKITNPIFYVFSDDSEWVQQNLHFKAPVQFITNKESTTAISDFYLISNCKHQIIANSTFSWWAAWLNNYENKIIIAPRQWFATAINTSDLIPSTWIRI
jgi:hypothetical protein